MEKMKNGTNKLGVEWLFRPKGFGGELRTKKHHFWAPTEATRGRVHRERNVLKCRAMGKKPDCFFKKITIYTTNTQPVNLVTTGDSPRDFACPSKPSLIE